MSNSSATLRHRFPSWLIRHWRSLSALSAALLAYALLGFLLVPRLASNAAMDYVNNTLHRKLTLESVQFNPFTLTAQIAGLQLLQADDEAIVSFDSLRVNFEMSSIWQRAYTFKLVQLRGPAVNLVISPEGMLNLAALSDSDSTASTDAEALPAIRIGRFELANGKLDLTDHSRPTPFSTTVTPISFTLDNFRTEPTHSNAFHFTGKSNADESFDLQGDFFVQPLRSVGRFNINNLQGTTIQGYLQDTLPFHLLAGAVTLQGEYHFALNEVPELQLSLPSIVITAIQIAPMSDATNAWVTVPTLNLRDSKIDLLNRAVAIQQVAIGGAHINAWLDAQYQLNLLELLGNDAPSDAPWNIRVNQLVVDDATLQLEDRSVTPAVQFTVNPVQLQAHNFNSAPNTSITLDTTLRINDSADLNASGSVDLDTLNSQLNIKLTNFALKDTQGYVAATTDVLIKDGQLGMEGIVTYSGSANSKTPQFSFSGNLNIDNLHTQDKTERKDFINWQSLQLHHLRYSMSPDALEIDQILARKPFFRFIINADGSSNIQRVLRIDTNTEDVEQHVSAPTPTRKVRIAKVNIDDGSANFADNSVRPTFASGIQALAGTISGISSANTSRAKVQLTGRVDSYAPVAINGEANFIAADTYSDITMSFNNMELTTFNPYSGKFAGYSIAKGKLSTEMHYQINDRKLDASHHVVIDQLEFGDATDSKDAVPLPIKLAVSLLKDRNGVIDLNLPVNGSIDDPKFKVGPVVWKAFVGLLTKIVTAPFAALGSLFGGGEELAYVDFAPGSALLSSSDIDKLTNLSKALVERPQLKLNIPLTVINEADAAAMNQAAFEQALAAELPDTVNTTTAQRLKALTTLYQHKLGNAPVLPADKTADDSIVNNIGYLEATLKPQFAIGDAERDALSHDRAKAVQAALLANSELTAERLFLTASSNDAKSPNGVVRMEMQLE